MPLTVHGPPSGGADTVSERNKNILNHVLNYIISQHQPCRPYSWPWHYIRRSRNKHKQKSMLWWVHIASQILEIVLLCHISMLLSGNRCDGIYHCHLVRLFHHDDHQYHYHSDGSWTDHEAIPHMATNDDEYDGYHIPKGTVVFGNAWLG